MKILPVLLSLVLAGCQATPAPVLPEPARTAPEPCPPVAQQPALVKPSLEQKIRQQAQYIEALISQNDALAAKMAAVEARPVQPASAADAPPPSAPAPKLPATPPALATPAEPMLTPNADGVIDLTAAAADPKSGELVNPFVVRSVPADSVREVSLHVTGILAGKTPCAVINDRLVQADETIESLTVERVESDAVCLRHAGQRLRVPVAEKPVRVRLPL